MTQGPKKQIGRILLQQRALSPEQLDRALADKKGGRLASRLAEDGTISDVAALKALSEQHGIPGIDLAQICLRLDDLEFLTGKKVDPYVALEGTLARVIDSAYSSKARGEAFYVGPRCPPEVLA